jgi:hypothetical protein
MEKLRKKREGSVDGDGSVREGKCDLPLRSTAADVAIKNETRMTGYTVVSRQGGQMHLVVRS